MKYRAEIDGLRALAVVPVILFHAGFDLFAGGFVGVDIFFVISGYLITTILIEEMEKGTFSVVGFYERRARRILPALFVVMLCCLPFAWMWMLPDQMQDFSQSLASIGLFASNILFWQESGYFGAAAEQKPLLHTWSLAVEEQYYLFFPLFLLLIWRFGRSSVVWLIAVLAIGSFLLSEWGWRVDSDANFYLAPTRAWELLAGSIAAFIVYQNGVQKSETLSLLGIGAIVVAVLVFDENTPFPSVYALVPILGTALLVVFGERNTFAAKLLSSTPVVGVGLVSYSAYLWHQPLFAFARIRSLGEPSDALMLLLCLLSMGLAFLSWRFIEQPFRRGGGWSRNSVYAMSVTGLAVFFSLGVFGHFSNGFSGRMDYQLSFDYEDNSSGAVKNFSDALDFSLIEETCFGGGKRRFILLGDSHAESLSRHFRSVIEESGGQLVTLTSNGCLPIPGTSKLPIQSNCIVAKEAYWEFAKQSNATVIFSSRWALNFIGSRFDNQEGGVEYGEAGKNYVVSDNSVDIFEYTASKLVELSTTNPLVLISQIPEAGWDVPSLLAKQDMFGVISQEVTTSYDVYNNRNYKVDNWLGELDRFSGIWVLYVNEIVCEESTMRCRNTFQGESLYRDDDHPSPLFTKLIAEDFANEFLEG